MPTARSPKSRKKPAGKPDSKPDGTPHPAPVPLTLRIGSFNCQNLFARAALLDMDDQKAAPFISAARQLEDALNKLVYTQADKETIQQLMDQLDPGSKQPRFIEVVETRRKLFKLGTHIVRSEVNGRDDWDGFLRYVPDPIDGRAVSNTARVICDVNADVLCMVEVESRPTLLNFAEQQLHPRDGFLPYTEFMLVDGNDTRQIDVAIASRYPLRAMYSHVNDQDGKGIVFSRDCLEIEVKLPDGRSLWMLLNHLKSQGYGAKADNDEKRTRQAKRIAQILAERYDLKRDLVAICLHDVLAAKVPDEKERWTYIYKYNKQRLDYILVSSPLFAGLQAVALERRGIHYVHKKNPPAKSYDTVTSVATSASDHAAVYADFLL
jgi:endonuclease/exonuclease/phosphatase family metal-dependent hydrolase